MSSVSYQKDQDQIVHLVLDKPNANANLMDQAFTESFAAAVEQLKEDEFAGVIVRSNKSTFFAGGNLDDLYATTQENAQSLFDMVQSIKASMRYLETCGKPVVACINGAALGGGWELALACHHRVSLSDNVKLGLPEVTLGLLPGGGGVIRMCRLLGLQTALPYLTEGRQFNPLKGDDLGLIDDIVDTQEQLIDAAVTYIKANPKAQQPYDVKGYKVPGGTPSHPSLAKMLPIAPAMMREKTKGVLPAPEAILSVMVEGLQVDIDTALTIETRYFVELVCGQVSKNMINTFWYQLNEINAGAARPQDVDKVTFSKVGVLGAGMMGAGIAYSAAKRGLQVVLKDVSIEAAEKGKSYSENLLGKQLSKGRISPSTRDEILARIEPSTNAEALEGCDIVIEAVFEDRSLKATVTQEAEAKMLSTGVFASNTSTLPITGLAEASVRPEQFIGLHFFSPVDKMPLVEIICGEKTSAETLAKAYDFVQQIGKTPIVVNDSRGFYTSRVFGTYANEGIAMLGEGISASAIENAAFLSGFPVGPLAVTDEVSMTLMEKIRNQTIRDLDAEGIAHTPHPADSVVDTMLELHRAGKAAGAGFYDYPDNGKKKLWYGLKKTFGDNAPISLDDLKDRLLYIQAIETVRCMEEGVLTSVRDANIGSIMGIGYPVWTGGILQFINQTGVGEFVARADSLSRTYGERFEVPQLLRDMVNEGRVFVDKPNT